MTLAQFRKLTENMDDELEIRIYDNEYSVYVPATKIEHTNKECPWNADRLTPTYFLGIE